MKLIVSLNWGHDFRPDYRRIVRILQALPSSIPVLATTATANNRVINDIKDQLGSSLQIVRGNLTRESLQLQNIQLPNPAQRMAWLAQHLSKISGSGIIYALTVRDAENVAKWLVSQNINAKCYHSQLENEVKENLENELNKPMGFYSVAKKMMRLLTFLLIMLFLLWLIQKWF